MSYCSATHVQSTLNVFRRIHPMEWFYLYASRSFCLLLYLRCRRTFFVVVVPSLILSAVYSLTQLSLRHFSKAMLHCQVPQRLNDCLLLRLKFYVHVGAKCLTKLWINLCFSSLVSNALTECTLRWITVLIECFTNRHFSSRLLCLTKYINALMVL
jgi:hypothetical protein